MCNRIEDLIEKARHYEDLWHEAIDENKRLEEQIKKVIATADIIDEHNQRLTRAGDELSVFCYMQSSMKDLEATCNKLTEWKTAKFWKYTK